MGEAQYKDFLDTYKKCVVHIIEQGYSHNFEKGDGEPEMISLWNEIYQLCLSILSISINLIYASSKEILEDLNSTLNDIQSEKKAENSSISLNYLSQPEVTRKLL